MPPQKSFSIFSILLFFAGTVKWVVASSFYLTSLNIVWYGSNNLFEFSNDSDAPIQ